MSLYTALREPERAGAARHAGTHDGDVHAPAQLVALARRSVLFEPQRFLDVAMRLSGFTKADIADLGKN